MRFAISREFQKKPFAAACVLCALEFLFCASGPAKDNSDLTKLADGVYARIVSPDGDAVSNSGFVVLEHSVLAFDTHFTPEAGQALLAGIRSVTTKAVRYVVNSHGHADHTHGNQAFPDAQLISSTSARRDMLEIDLPSLNRTIGITQNQLEKLHKDISKETDPAAIQRLSVQVKSREEYLQAVSPLKILAPFVTLDDSLTLQDGKLEIRIMFLGVGHTDGDVVLLLPSQRIAFVGDLFFNQAIPNVQDASILQWMKTLESVVTLAADRFVPGHGPIGSKKEVEEFLDYFEDLKSMVEPAVARGDSVDLAIKEIRMPAKYSSYRFQNFFPSNVQKMYAELKTQQLSATPAGTFLKIGTEKPTK